MRILLITGYFPPERAAAPNINFELARELVRLGHHVVVATGFPRYNLDAVPPAYRRRLAMRETMEGINVIRTWYPRMPRHSPIARGLDILLMAGALSVSALRAGRQDVATVFSPPITTGVSGLVASRLFRYGFVYNVHDLFPQNAVDVGVLRNKALIRWFTAMARVIYRKAAYITVISSTNRSSVMAAGARPEHTVVVPDWVDTDVVRPAERRNAFSAAHGLNDKFVVSFSGVMGFTQDLDTVIGAASLLAGAPSVHFVLAGDGIERARIEAEAVRLGLTNVTFLGMVPQDEIADVFHASDACLATLRAEVKTSPVPSKIAWAMAAGRPVVTCLDLEGEAPKLVNRAGCGFSVPPADPRALADAILHLSRNPDECRRMGELGRQYAVANLSVRAAAATLCGLFEVTAKHAKTGDLVAGRRG